MTKQHFPPRPKKERIRTRIWLELPSDTNPFMAEKTLCHGYDVEALYDQCNWMQILFLLLTGELPAPEQERLLNLIMTAGVNPGPRDAAVRAAMNCGVGKTPVATILTTGLTVRGGMYEGGMHVEFAMRFLNGDLPANGDRDANDAGYAAELIRDYRRHREEEGDGYIVPLPEQPPGFGLYFDERDPRAVSLLARIEAQGTNGPALQLARRIESVLAGKEGVWLTLPGVFAACCCDLGLSPEQGGGLYLIAGSAGILAHGVEQLPRKWNEYPFWADQQYYEYVGPEPTKKVEST